MAIIIARITNNLNYSFTMPGPSFIGQQSSNLVIPANAVDLDLLTLTTDDGLWSIQPQLEALERTGQVTVTGTIDTASFDYDGVSTIHADNNPAVRGNIRLVSGTNITLSQVGQNITINSSGGGGGGSPSAPNNSIQFNNSGSFGGSSDLTWDGTDLAALNIATSSLHFDTGDMNIITTAGGINIFSDVGSSILLKAGPLAGIEIDNNVVGLGRPMFFDTVNTAARNAFGNHPGWMIYNTDTNKPEFNNGSVWAAMTGGGSGSPAGSNTWIQYNDSGAFGADGNFNWDKTGQTLSITGTAGSGPGFRGEAVAITSDVYISNGNLWFFGGPGDGNIKMENGGNILLNGTSGLDNASYMTFSGGAINSIVFGGTNFRVDAAGNISNSASLRQQAIGAPALSSAAEGSIYFDSVLNKFLVSENGGAYVPLVGAGGGGGTVVANVVVNGDHNGVPLTTLYTPTVTGVYRISTYAQATNLPSNPDNVAETLTWNDGIGVAASTSLFIQREYYLFGASASFVIQDITYTAVTFGEFGNSVSITYANDGIAGAETVSVVGTDITVHMQDSVSTATQIKTAIDNTPAATALVTDVISGTGSNPQTAVSQTFLVGGQNSATVTAGGVTVTYGIGAWPQTPGSEAAAANNAAIALNAGPMTGVTAIASGQTIFFFATTPGSSGNSLQIGWFDPGVAYHGGTAAFDTDGAPASKTRSFANGSDTIIRNNLIDNNTNLSSLQLATDQTGRFQNETIVYAISGQPISYQLIYNTGNPPSNGTYTYRFIVEQFEAASGGGSPSAPNLSVQFDNAGSFGSSAEISVLSAQPGGKTLLVGVDPTTIVPGGIMTWLDFIQNFDGQASSAIVATDLQIYSSARPNDLGSTGVAQLGLNYWSGGSALTAATLTVYSPADWSGVGITQLRSQADIFLCPASGQVPNQSSVLIGDSAGQRVGDQTAILDIQSTEQGFLPPRMTQAQRNIITVAANGITYVENFAPLTGATFTINGVVLTEGVEWTASTDNLTTATSLSAAITTATATTLCTAVAGFIAGFGSVTITANTPGPAGNSITTVSSDNVNLVPSGPTLAQGKLPAPALIVFNTDTNQPEFYNGTTWVAMTGGGSSNSVITVTTNSIAGADNIIQVDATSGALIITLPVASSSLNAEYTIKKIDASANAVTIQGNGADTIDGSNTQLLNVQWASRTVVCNGASWILI